jgi:hypothetical protein
LAECSAADDDDDDDALLLVFLFIPGFIELKTRKKGLKIINQI